MGQEYTKNIGVHVQQVFSAELQGVDCNRETEVNTTLGVKQSSDTANCNTTFSTIDNIIDWSEEDFIV